MSSIQLEPRNLIDVLPRLIAAIEKDRRDDDEQTVLNSRRRICTGGPFWKRTYRQQTVDERRAELEDNKGCWIEMPNGEFVEYPSTRFDGQYKTAKRILNLAYAAIDGASHQRVTVDADDFARFQGFYFQTYPHAKPNTNTGSPNQTNP
jgi:hypothetical protein